MYRPSRRQRLFLQGLAGVVGVLSLGMLALPFLEWHERRLAAIAFFGGGGIGFLLLAAYLVAAAARNRVLLFEDAIEFVEVGRARVRLRRDEIRGLRVIDLEHGFQLFVFELHAGRKRVTSNLYVERDEVLLRWLATLTNLDEL